MHSAKTWNNLHMTSFQVNWKGAVLTSLLYKYQNTLPPKQLTLFLLGFCNVYRLFIPDFIGNEDLLNQLSRKGGSRKVQTLRRSTKVLRQTNRQSLFGPSLRSSQTQPTIFGRHRSNSLGNLLYLLPEPWLMEKKTNRIFFRTRNPAEPNYQPSQISQVLSESAQLLSGPFRHFVVPIARKYYFFMDYSALH